MNTPLPEERLAPIRQALFRGKKIEAIKLYREAALTDLLEAKTEIEKLEAALRAASPEKFLAPPRKGCLGVVMLAGVISAAFIWWLVSK